LPNTAELAPAGPHHATPRRRRTGSTSCAFDWVPPHGPWDDTLVFVFDGGALHPKQIDAIKISDQELDAFRFCTEAEASDLLRPYVWSRATLALDAMRTGQMHYAHYGSAISDDING
jgi:8-oxo-dGTP diphosphatase